MNVVFLSLCLLGYRLITTLNWIAPSLFDHSKGLHVGLAIQWFLIIASTPFLVWCAHIIKVHSQTQWTVFPSCCSSSMRSLLFLHSKIIMVGVLLFILSVNALQQWGFNLSLPNEPSRVIYLNLFLMPIPEEILFRGMMCAVLAQWFGWPLTILTSGLSFGLMHFWKVSTIISDPEFLRISLSGCFLAWIFYRTRALIIPLAWHLLGNIAHTAMHWYPHLWNRLTSLVTYV